MSQSFKEKILPIEKFMKSKGMTGRFVSSDHLHMTLVFLGNIEDEQIIHQLISLVQNFDFGEVILKPGLFEQWRDLLVLRFDENRELSIKVQNLKEQLKKHGFVFDDKSFKAHITIARKLRLNSTLIKSIKIEPQECFEQFINELNRMKDFNNQNLLLDEMNLYESKLTQNGPNYILLAGSSKKS
ncbi:RNA 2',3'-cyclic phosphodiesterase [Ileibacterium valens]|nr:RNA 2',3'-cyclic phosphodiesterase [Ileibacterium valens]